MPMLLVTGGAGFIGGHTARRALALGWHVRILDNRSSNHSSNFIALQKLGAEILVGDVRDEEITRKAVEGCDAVVHLAAQVSVPHSLEYPEETMEINVGGTGNLLQACQNHGVKRFVMASSAAVYGNNDAFPLDEVQAGQFHSPYADSKWQNEHQVLEARKAGMEAIALRFFNVYGTGQHSGSVYAAVIPQFIQLALKGEPVTVFGNGLQTRDFVHVDDVTQALLMLATGAWKGDLDHVYNVCTETEVSMLDLLENIHSVLMNIAPHIPRRDPIHAPARPGDILRSVGSKARLVQDTSWRPAISLEEGLHRQISNCLEGA